MNASDVQAGQGGETPVFDMEVDASGLTCPCILRAKKALAQMESGQVLRVVTTDRNAVRDFVLAPDRQRCSRSRSRTAAARISCADAGGERVPPGFVQCRMWRFGVLFVV